MGLTNYLVKLGTIYITDTGLIGGTKYISNIEGLQELGTEYAEAETLDIHSNPVFQVTEIGQKGKLIKIRLLGATYDLMEDLLTLREAQKADGNPRQLVLTHPVNTYFSYDLQVNIGLIEYGEMMSNQFRNVVIPLRTIEAT